METRRSRPRNRQELEELVRELGLQNQLSRFVQAEIVRSQDIWNFTNADGTISGLAVSFELFRYFWLGIICMTFLRCLRVFGPFAKVVARFVRNRVDDVAGFLTGALGKKIDSYFTFEAVKKAFAVFVAGLTSLFVMLRFDQIMTMIGTLVALSSSVDQFFSKGIIVLWAGSWAFGFKGQLGPFNGIQELILISMLLISFVSISLNKMEVADELGKKIFRNTMNITKILLSMGLPLLVSIVVRPVIPQLPQNVKDMIVRF